MAIACCWGCKDKFKCLAMDGSQDSAFYGNEKKPELRGVENYAMEIDTK